MPRQFSGYVRCAFRRSIGLGGSALRLVGITFAAQNLSSHSRQALRKLLLQEQNQFLANVAAQVPGSGRVGSAHQGAKFHGAVGGIGDLQAPDFPIPQL